MSYLSTPTGRIVMPEKKAVAVYSVAVTYSINSTAPANSQQFHFMCDLPDVEPGSLLVVKDRNGYNLVRAVKIYETPGDKARAWVVDKVDISREQARKRRLELEAKLRSAIKDQELLEQGRQLANSDPLIASLVSQLEQMQ